MSQESGRDIIQSYPFTHAAYSWRIPTFSVQEHVPGIEKELYQCSACRRDGMTHCEFSGNLCSPFTHGFTQTLPGLSNRVMAG